MTDDDTTGVPWRLMNPWERNDELADAFPEAMPFDLREKPKESRYVLDQKDERLEHREHPRDIKGPSVRRSGVTEAAEAADNCEEIEATEIGMKPHRWNVDRITYHADRDCISAGRLVSFAESPPDFQLSELGGVLENPSTKATLVGTCIHTMYLEPAKFKEQFVPMQTFKGKGAINRRREWLVGTIGKIRLTAADSAIALGCTAALMFNKRAERIRSALGPNELAVRWTNPDTGLDCRCLMDMLRPSIRILADLKSIDGHPTSANFRRAVEDYRYDVKAVHYLEGAELLLAPMLKGEHLEFVWIVVGKTPPHRVRIFRLDREGPTYRAAVETRRRWMERLATCHRTGDWADDDELRERDEGVLSIERADWAIRREA